MVTSEVINGTTKITCMHDTPLEYCLGLDPVGTYNILYEKPELHPGEHPVLIADSDRKEGICIGGE